MRALRLTASVIALGLGTAVAFGQGGGGGAGGSAAGGAGGSVGAAGSASGTSGAPSGASGGRGGGNPSAAVAGTPAGPPLTSEQGRRVTEALRGLHVEPTSTDTDFEMREGVAVPESVTLQACPEELGEIVKILEDCQLMRVKDQILLVEPNTRRIIEVIRVAS